jgi:hypothetical protein
MSTLRLPTTGPARNERLEVQVRTESWSTTRFTVGTGPTSLVLSLILGMCSCGGGGTPVQPQSGCGTMDGLNRAADSKEYSQTK